MPVWAEQICTGCLKRHRSCPRAHLKPCDYWQLRSRPPQLPPLHAPQRSPLGALSPGLLGALCCLGVLCWHHLSQCRLLFIARILYSWDGATAAEGEVSCECWAPQFQPNEMSTKHPCYFPAPFSFCFAKLTQVIFYRRAIMDNKQAVIFFTYNGMKWDY